MTAIQRDSRASLKQFAVAWDNAADAASAWRLDPRHAAEPAPPLEQAVAARGYASGFSRAASALGLPLRAATRLVNGFLYRSFLVTSAARHDPQDQLQIACESLGEAVVSLRDRWDAELLPEVERHLGFWASFDLKGASLTALIAHYDQTLRKLDRIWEMYYLVSLPVNLARSQLIAQHTALFGQARAYEAQMLLEWLDGPDLAMEHALLQLCRSAGRTPIARDVLRWCADHEVMAVLGASEAGRPVLENLNTFLDIYGHRSEGGMLVGSPTWLEDPSPVIGRMREAVLDPQRLLGDNGAREERLRLEEEVSARLERLPNEYAQRYNRALRAAQHAAMVQAEAESCLLQRCMAAAREVFVELGRRFAEEGVIEAPADIVMLELREVRQTAETLPWVDQRSRIARRRAELDYSASLNPVELLGRPESEGSEGALPRLLATL